MTLSGWEDKSKYHSSIGSTSPKVPLLFDSVEHASSPNKDDLIRATMAFNASQPKDFLDESTNRLATNPSSRRKRLSID